MKSPPRPCPFAPSWMDDEAQHINERLVDANVQCPCRFIPTLPFPSLPCPLPQTPQLDFGSSPTDPYFARTATADRERRSSIRTQPATPNSLEWWYWFCCRRRCHCRCKQVTTVLCRAPSYDCVTVEPNPLVGRPSATLRIWCQIDTALSFDAWRWNWDFFPYKGKKCNEFLFSFCEIFILLILIYISRIDVTDERRVRWRALRKLVDVMLMPRNDYLAQWDKKWVNENETNPLR